MTPEELIREATQARERAWAPYSRYRVGAALLTANGAVIPGCNIENASYGLTVCAERTAIFAAVAQGITEFAALAVVTEDGASMCGACRQVAWEFSEDLVVYLGDAGGRFTVTSIRELLPHAFSKRDLG